MTGPEQEKCTTLEMEITSWGTLSLLAYVIDTEDLTTEVSMTTVAGRSAKCPESQTQDMVVCNNS